MKESHKNTIPLYTANGLTIPALISGKKEDIPAKVFANKKVVPEIFIDVSREKNLEEILREIPPEWFSIYTGEIRLNGYRIYMEKGGRGVIVGRGNEISFSIIEGGKVDIEWVRKVTKVTRKIKERNEKEIVVRGRAGLNIFFTTACIRAVWHFLLEENKDAVPTFELWYEGEVQENENPLNNLIRYSVFYWIASCCGVDRVILPPLQSPVKEPNDIRLVANIEHIAREETSILKFYDPFAGSFFMERITEEVKKAAGL